MMNRVQKQQDNSHAWIEAFTRLGAEGVTALDHLEQITTRDVRFRDPFNDIVGTPSLRALLEHTRRQVQEVRLEVLDTADSGERLYLKWEMSGRLPVGTTPGVLGPVGPVL